MGEVYRARDAGLKRDVALKVMPADVASDPVRVARFQREAELVAALSHPGIAAIYGLAEANGIRALVLELVEGETLAERLSRAPLPLETALDLGRQLAVALDYAHERGIVHRDLKPSNIKLTPDGQLKVLDFGLAKAVEADGAGNSQGGRTMASDSSGASTLTSPAVISQAGMLLGTAAYMAPEQARGQTVDRRADIWAFGCVLFEMLTGRRAFEGETVSDTISTILAREPDWAALPKGTSSGTRRLLTRCLQKDVRLRLPQIGVARLDLAETDAPATAIGATPNSPGRWLWLAAAGVALAAMAAGGVLLLRPVADSAQGVGIVRFEVGPPPGAVRIGHMSGNRGTQSPAPHMAVSPDGKALALVASRADGNVRLWVRSLSSTEVRELAGTDDASFPFWSPDGTRVAFFASARLKHVRLDSGSIVDVCPAELGEGGTWGADDTILFAPTPSSGIVRVSANGGSAQPVTSPDISKVFHRWPAFLADGRRFVYLEVTGPAQGVVRLRSLETGEDREVMPSATRALPVGEFLLFAREGRLVAQPFDDQAGQMLGEPVLIADSVGSSDVNSRAGFHASESGVLVHRAGFIANRRLVWLDRTGREAEQVGEEGPITRLALSADGKKAAVEVDAVPSVGSLFQTPSDLWFVDVERGGIRNRLTSEPGDEFSPVWSPDGGSLYLRRKPWAERVQRNPRPREAVGKRRRTLRVSRRVWHGTLRCNARRTCGDWRYSNAAPA